MRAVYADLPGAAKPETKAPPEPEPEPEPEPAAEIKSEATEATVEDDF